MKVRQSFVANSSSSSFIIMTNQEKPAALNFYGMEEVVLKDFLDLENSEYDDNEGHYRYNWRPESIDECYEESLRYLTKIWISRLTNSKFVSYVGNVDRYAYDCATHVQRFQSNNEKSSQTFEELLAYFTNEYTYVSNTYDMLKRIHEDYYKNFIIANSSTIRRNSNNICDNFWEFKKKIHSLDNMKCFSFQQYVNNLTIHNQGIFESNPICAEEWYKICTDLHSKEKNAILWYNRVINTANKVKVILLAYMYCYYNGKVLQHFELSTEKLHSDKLEEILLRFYNSTKFMRPFSNFDVIDKYSY